jgi:hypothetical protein
MAVAAGDRVTARSWAGEFERRAITGVVKGRDFPVVWICTSEEWEAAKAEHREPVGLPWPAEDVAEAEPSAR